MNVVAFELHLLERVLAIHAQDFGIKLFKGASKEVEDLAKKIVTEFGKDILLNIAKIHFKTTKEVMKEN